MKSKQPDTGWAKVLSVEPSSLQNYPYFITGLLTTASGAVESFCWHVPSLDWIGYDLSEVRVAPSLRAKVAAEAAACAKRQAEFRQEFEQPATA